ncbi:Os08g0469200, partial [Oryza sativa Japonica Group]
NEIGYNYYLSYGDDSEWRLGSFLDRTLALCGIAGAVGLLVQDALTDKGPSVWTGVAGVLQCVLVLIRYFFKLTQLVYIYALWISVDYSDL